MMEERKRDVASFADDIKKLELQIKNWAGEAEKERQMRNEAQLLSVKIEAQRDALSEVIRMHIQAAHGLPIKPETDASDRSN